MNEVQIDVGNRDEGLFFIEENGRRIATMVFHINGRTLVAMHTEVSDALRGKGIGNKLVDAMADYARKSNLKVKPLCPFTRAIFDRHPEKYGDVLE